MLKAKDRRFSDTTLKVCGSWGYWPKSLVIRCKSGGGPDYFLVQEWTVLLFSLALAAVCPKIHGDRTSVAYSTIVLTSCMYTFYCFSIILLSDVLQSQWE